MAGVTCAWCALPYEVWPEGGCPGCGCGEPASASAPVGEVSGDGSGTALLEFDGAVEREAPGIDTPTEPVEIPAVRAEPDYAAWTVAELRAECERRKLSTSGTKATLVARLAGG